MCGITGAVNFNGNIERETLHRMVSTLDHRGPDDRGSEIITLNRCCVGLGQTRLAILDLSPGGRQPMHFDGLTIVYNGEVYNYMEIRAQLEEKGHRFNSSSDTEVILHAFREWGAECVSQFIGMFSFVILDHNEEKLFALRDRAGVKPFYYHMKNGLFLFGSELKPFHVHPGFEKEIDERSLSSYLDFGYVPAPFSIFKHTRKLEPAHILTLDLKNSDIHTEQYWNAHDCYKMPKLEIGYEDAKLELHKLLKSAFSYRMVSDVPVGIFLSGGYDSSAVAAILQSDSSSRLKTFTIGFEEGNNEAPAAKQTAKFLGTDHHEYTCTTKEAKEIIPDLPFYYDEPFADSSAIPTMLVSRFARKQVTVALSADAGDEIFGGYMSYPQLLRHQEQLENIPGYLKPVSKLAFSMGSSLVPKSYPSFKHKLKGVSVALNRDRYRQAAELFRYSNILPGFYKKDLLLNGPDVHISSYNTNPAGFHDIVEYAMAVDYRGYLQNDILTKVDRATMSVSLEGREPLLDHRILEFAARLPVEYKLQGKKTKRILRDIVHHYIPREMMERPKAGFSLPIYSWLRDDLSWILDEYLSREKLKLSGLLNVPNSLNLVNLFRKNNLYYSPLIWKLLMFQMWHDRWMR